MARKEKARARAWRLDNSGLGDGLCALRLKARSAIAKACAEGEAEGLASMTMPDSIEEMAAWQEAKQALPYPDYHQLCWLAGIPTSRNGLDNAYLPKSKHVDHWHSLVGTGHKHSGFRDALEETAMIEICRRADLELHPDEDGVRRSLPAENKQSKASARAIINAIKLGTSVRLGERGVDGADYYEARNEAHRLLALKGQKSIGDTSRAAIIAAIG